MFKKTLLTTASVVVATCGAITAANAGQLKLRLIDVNVNTTPDPTTTQHIDKDLHADANGSTGPNGTGYPINSRSVDKGFVDEVKPEGVFSHVVIADERMGGADNPIGGWYEIDVFEVTGGSSLGTEARFDISLEGDSDPWFKADVNCNNAIRAGSDDIHSISATTGFGGQSIQAGQNEASCFVNLADGEGSSIPDTAVGWLLPIETKDCGDLVVKIVVTRDQGNAGSLVTETSHRIQTCEDSLKSTWGYFPVKIDYFADFRSFLIDPNYYDGKEEHVASLWAHTGAVRFDIHNFLVDLKEDDKKSHTNVFDLNDIDHYELVVSFEDLTGIRYVQLFNGSRTEAATLDRVANTATWYLSQSDVRDQFCLDYASGLNKGDKDKGCLNWFKIHAFGPHSSDPYNGPIDHQIAVVTESEFYLTPDDCSGDHCVKFFSPELEGVGEQVAHLNKTGIVFGPFDWVADDDSIVKSVFRVTGIPKDDIEDLKGSILIQNSSNKELKGEWKVDYNDSQMSEGHDLILNSTRIEELLVNAGAPDNGKWGRGDLTFTFYVGGRIGYKMDMDRLMATNGTYGDYGDNSNDGFSLKARSCDDGRFGSHVANKLDPEFTYFLTGLCSVGELSRRGIYRR